MMQFHILNAEYTEVDFNGKQLYRTTTHKHMCNWFHQLMQKVSLTTIQWLTKTPHFLHHSLKNSEVGWKGKQTVLYSSVQKNINRVYSHNYDSKHLPPTQSIDIMALCFVTSLKALSLFPYPHSPVIVEWMKGKKQEVERLDSIQRQSQMSEDVAVRRPHQLIKTTTDKDKKNMLK